MFLIQKYGGITKYFCELIKNLSPEHQFNLSVLFSDNQHLKDDRKIFRKIYIPMPNNDFRGKSFLKRNAYNINKLCSRYHISLTNYDILHPTYYDTYFLNNLKKPYIITVHDLIEFKFKEQYKNNSRIPQMKQIIKKANRIISVSENTKKDLIEIFNVNPNKIDTIYHGFNKPVLNENINIFGRYILFVGIREGYKNFAIFIKIKIILIAKLTYS